MNFSAISKEMKGKEKLFSKQTYERYILTVVELIGYLTRDVIEITKKFRMRG